MIRTERWRVDYISDDREVCVDGEPPRGGAAGRVMTRPVASRARTRDVRHGPNTADVLAGGTGQNVLMTPRRIAPARAPCLELARIDGGSSCPVATNLARQRASAIRP